MKKYTKNIDEKDLRRLKEFIVTKITRLEGISEISKFFLIFVQLKTLRLLEVGWLGQGHSPYKRHNRDSDFLSSVLYSTHGS